MSTPRTPDDVHQIPFELGPFPIAENADGGSVTTRLHKFKTRGRITRVQYLSVTGLAEHSSNNAIISLKNGSTVMASWNTDADLMTPDAGIPANDFLLLTLATDIADTVFAAGDEVDFNVAESGTTTVPAAQVIIEGFYF